MQSCVDVFYLFRSPRRPLIPTKELSRTAHRFNTGTKEAQPATDLYLEGAVVLIKKQTREQLAGGGERDFHYQISLSHTKHLLPSTLLGDGH